MAAILFNSAVPFKQIVSTLSTKSPIRNLVKIAQGVSEKKTFLKLRNFIHVNSPGARADNPEETEFCN